MSREFPAIRWLRCSLAFVWLATGVLVLHPSYRAVGSDYLTRLGLPVWLMYCTCVTEFVLGVWLLLRPQGKLLALGQIASVLFFTGVLARLEPELLVHYLGPLSKNIPFVLVVWTVWLVERRGWTEGAWRVLRTGMAVVWITEGLFPKILFQQAAELELATRMHLPGDPSQVVAILGALQVMSGVLALGLRGRILGWLLGCQVFALVALPTMVGILQPEMLVHPFGPLTKNVPILVGTTLLLRRCCSTSG